MKEKGELSWEGEVVIYCIVEGVETVRLDQVPTPNKIFIILLRLREVGREVELGNSEIVHNRVQTIS